MTKKKAVSLPLYLLASLRRYYPVQVIRVPVTSAVVLTLPLQKTALSFRSPSTMIITIVF